MVTGHMGGAWITSALEIARTPAASRRALSPPRPSGRRSRDGCSSVT